MFPLIKTSLECLHIVYIVFTQCLLHEEDNWLLFCFVLCDGKILRWTGRHPSPFTPSDLVYVTLWNLSRKFYFLYYSFQGRILDSLHKGNPKFPKTMKQFGSLWLVRGSADAPFRWVPELGTLSHMSSCRFTRWFQYVAIFDQKL